MSAVGFWFCSTSSCSNSQNSIHATQDSFYCGKQVLYRQDHPCQITGITIAHVAMGGFLSFSRELTTSEARPKMAESPDVTADRRRMQKDLDQKCRKHPR